MTDPRPEFDEHADRIASLRAEWSGADADRKQVIEAEVKALQDEVTA